LKAGIPIAKTDMLRSLLEKNGYRLTGSSNLGQYVSMALKQEIEQIKQELEMPGQVGLTRDISVIFEAAQNIVSFIFPNMFNVVCFSHTLDNVGNHFEIPTQKEFGSLWIRIFCNSCKAKLLWKGLYG